VKFLSSEWIKAAGDDLLAVKEMMHNPELTNLAAFHAQQCVEKSFKAVLEEKDAEIPRIHGLIRLYELAGVYLDIKADLDMLKTLDQLYIDSRYPGITGLLPEGKPALDEALSFYKFAENIYSSVKDYLISS
jgi:HEPN domain-containing protein